MKIAAQRAPLAGRDEELAVLRRFVAGATADGGALLVRGAPGLGKSALLELAAGTARAAGGRVLRASGVEFEADVAFSGLNQLLLPLSDDMETLGPRRRDALAAAVGFDRTATVDRLAVADATLALLRRAAGRRPLLVLLDDVMWLDRSSAFVLGFVARRLAESPIGLVAASRPHADSFFERADLPELVLEPLDRTASCEVLRAGFADLAPAVVGRLATEADGNPLALLELPATLTAAQRAGVELLPRVLPLTRRLQALFAARVAALGEPVRRQLLVAVLEGTGDLALLRAAGGGGIDVLGDAVDAGLVSVEDDRRLAFRHPLVRSTVVELAGDRDRRLAHRALARALEGDPERRAWHLAEAATAPDEEVAGLIERAAELRRRRGDPVGAVTALLRAADLSDTGGERSRRLAKAAYVGADVAGGIQRASGLLVDARRADPALAGSLQPAVATAYLLLNGEGDVDTAHRVLTGAIDAVPAPRSADDAALTEALHTLMTVCWFGGGRPGLWQPLDEGIAGLLPEPPAVLSLCSRIFSDPARTSDADLEALDVAIAELPAESDPARIVRTGMAAFFVDRVPDCRDAHWRVVRDGRDGGGVASAVLALIHLSLDDVCAGRWDEGLELAEEGLALCEAGGYRILAWPLHFARALVAAGRGEDAVALRIADDMTEWAAPRQAQAISMYASHLRAVVARGHGEFEDAYRHASAISPPGVLASHVPLAVWTAMLLVEAAVRSGHHAQAAAHVAAMDAAGLGRLSPRLGLLVAASRAMVAPPVAAAARYEEALATPGGDRWPFDLAVVHLVYGEHLRRARATGRARAHLEAAIDVFDRLRAEPWARRARAELRATGRTRSRPDRRGAPLLTSQELQIARLAAAGLSNKEIGARLFLSPRTVGGHLYRVFPKLDITSRAALRDALQAQAGAGRPSP